MNGDKAQLDKFKDAARELECNNDEEQFARKLRKLVKPGSGQSKKGPVKAD